MQDSHLYYGQPSLNLSQTPSQNYPITVRGLASDGSLQLIPPSSYTLSGRKLTFTSLPSQFIGSSILVMYATGAPSPIPSPPPGPTFGKPGGSPGVFPRVPNMTGGMRLRENSQYVTGASGLHSSHFKVEANGPFSAVRIWVADKNTANPPTFAALVAATETGATDTVAHAYLPIYQGATYNELSSSTVPAGWRSVTWNGAASVTLPATTFWQPTNYATVACSDWIPCKSLPRTDVVGGRPMIVFRVAQQGSTANFTQGNSTMSGWTSESGQPYYRLFMSNNTSTDDVTNIGNAPATVGPLAPNYEMYCWVEFLYDNPSRNVCILGDSRDSSAYSTSGSSWALTAILSASQTTSPVNVMNLAGSGHAQYEYIGLLTNMLNAGYVPTDVFLPGFSQNGFQQNHAGAEGFVGGNMLLMQRLRSLGAQIWMTTDYAVNGYTGASETSRQECIAAAREMGASGLVNLIDTDPLLSDYTNPAAPIILAQYDQGDHVHANPAGQAVLSQLLTSLWR